MIHNLPEEIAHDILFRLPRKSLIKCTSVCKPWRSIIKNPSFIRTHLVRSIKSNNQLGTHLLLLHCVPRAIISSYVHTPRTDEPVEEHYFLRYDNHDFDLHCKIEFPSVSREQRHNNFLRVVGSCNGLIFLADDKDYLGYTFILFNPSIRKSVILPKLRLTSKTRGLYSACIGLGFDALTNDYKVVRLLTDQRESPTSSEVYSLARGSWSSPSHFAPVCEVRDPRSPQAFVKGALHWEAWHRTGNRQSFILAFDVSSELFREIMLPKSFRRDVSMELGLSVTGDGKSIGLFTTNHRNDLREFSLDIWVMKEYCKEDSWTKLITVSPPGPQMRVPYKPLCFRKSGEVVLVLTNDFEDRHELVSLDPVSNQFKSLGVREYKYYYAESYEESLILLDKTTAISY